jgi:hypothetical protein
MQAMNKSDEQIKSDWNELEWRIEEALKQLMCYEKDIQSYLLRCVASLCDVDEKRILSNTDVIYIAHARWLYWHAYRYMTNESYEKIAKSTSQDGFTFSTRAVQSGVNKMSMMISNEPLWQKRWTVIKRIIKLRDRREEKVDNTITINIPRELKDKINILIKEK